MLYEISNAFHEGGWGMYPTSVIGLVGLGVAARFAARPQAGARALLPLVLATLASGLLGTLSGFIATFRYAAAHAAADATATILVGVAESLHNLTLALVFSVLAGLLSAVGRQRRGG